MAFEARYRHTNIVAKDWRKLAAFYERVFGCRRIGPERRARGAWVEQVTGVADAEVDGVHLLMPGCEADGPTLEIFQYNRVTERPPTALNMPGFAHIAFEVDDMGAARAEAEAAGARALGQMVTTPIAGAGSITLIYMADPEGNVFELQRWEAGAD